MNEDASASSTSENRHVPVLLNEIIEALRPCTQNNSTIVDCTLGGAGHSFSLLELFPQIKLLACDQDLSAIDAAKHRLAPFIKKGRVDFFHGNFAQLVDSPSSIASDFAPPWGAVLMDLGFSSNQLEDPTYGMSFMLEGALDMRLSRSGETAWELLLSSSEQDLGDILKVYGEMRGAHRLARRIKEAIAREEVTNSTSSLAHFLERLAGGRKKGEIHPATLVFQSLRIAVNDELRVLDHFLENVILKLRPRGRIAIITFHSLEDRIVKNWGKQNAITLAPVTKKPLVASQEEMKMNPRSRSAKLRVYERIQ